MQGDVENFTRWVELHKEESSLRHMHRFITASGERSVYDSVSLCNRCAQCYSKCPTALVSRDENLSPRGRTQLVRMVMEERLKLDRDGEHLRESFESCLQCWGCVSACSSGVPVPELVLEALRALKRKPGSAFEGFVLGRLSSGRKLLDYPLKAFNLLRKSGLYALLIKIGAFRMAGQAWLGRFDSAGLPVKFKFLDRRLKDSPALLKSVSLPPACYYFSPCSVNYFYPETGLATLELLYAFVGPVKPLNNGCCGYAAYSKGRLEDARTAARTLIAACEAQGLQGPVVTDCPSCAAFLKNLEQLFADDAAWRDRAAAFGANVRHIAEVVTPEKFRAKLRAKKTAVSSSGRPPAYPAPFENMRVTFNDSCAACHRLGVSSGPRKLLQIVFGDRYAEMPEADLCCGGADGYALFQPELSARLGRRKAANAASVQPDVVVATSPFCIAQLSVHLKKYYPQAVAVHYSNFLRDLLAEHHDAKKA